jgi:hypothetical protein
MPASGQIRPVLTKMLRVLVVVGLIERRNFSIERGMFSR